MGSPMTIAPKSMSFVNNNANRIFLPCKRKENFPKWYKWVLKEGKLAQKSSVPGCMNILKNGMAIWEKITNEFNRILNEQELATNHYFPIFISAKFFEKEAANEHMEGFAPECAVVTHLRMKKDANGKMIPDPESKLNEPLVVRPTSELIIGEFLRETILENNELPLEVNQWANVVRAEHHTRAFLRTMEFLWQEGHCAYATKEEALANAKKMAQVYAAFMAEVCAFPVIMGEKTEEERFAGAVRTFCLEAMMQDGKAVQAGTSHYLGQNFAKMSDIKFKNKKNEKCYVETTSWGMSTRVIGCLIMIHADDYGMRIPPRLANVHVVIIPSGKESKSRDEYILKIQNLFKETKKRFFDQKICIKVDKRDKSPGTKYWDNVREGYPIIMKIGKKEADQNTVTLNRRDQDPLQACTLKIDDLVTSMIQILGEIQMNYFSRAKEFLDQHIRTDITTKKDLIAFFHDEYVEKNQKLIKANKELRNDNKRLLKEIKDPGNENNQLIKKNKESIEFNNKLINENEGLIEENKKLYKNDKGFVRAKWSEDREVEKKLKKKYGITIRCLPFDQDGLDGTCILTNKRATKEAIFAKAY